jgi:hypothetical protein
MVDGASGATPRPGTGSPRLDRPSAPVRIRIASLGIDLPVVSSERTLPGNPTGYPLCDVAQYWTRFDLPGAPGTAWIYAHAQPGMFLPLLETAEATDGEGLLDVDVTVQLRDGRLLTYRIDEVRQHAVGARIARDPSPSRHRLVLHTSEGPPGTVPKLQLAGHLVGAAWAREPAPRPQPRVCSTAPSSDRPGATARPSGRPGLRSPPASPGASVGTSPGTSAGASRGADAATGPGASDRPTSVDLVAMVLGAAGVLLGAGILAWVIVGRRD